MSTHKEEWKRLFEEYSKSEDEVSQYRARCVMGLLDNKTYDAVEEVKPIEISFIK